MPRVRNPQKGSLILVALCFVVVLGIALASYLAVSNQAMKLSNRSVQTGVSEQLAEMGLEEALMAFNTNNWPTASSNGTPAAWSISGTTATTTIAVPSNKYGSSGISGTIKLRVDNYNAFQLDSIWSSAANYKGNNLVGRSGTWYRSVADSTNQTPPSSSVPPAYWVEEQAAFTSQAWNSIKTYRAQEMVIYSGTWYRCTFTNTNLIPPSNFGYWTTVPAVTVDNNLVYSNEALLDYFGTWYRYLTATGWDNAPPTLWRWNSGVNYKVGDMIAYGSPNVWYRCIQAHTSNSTTPNLNPSYWNSSTLTTPAATQTASTWLSTTTYGINDVVYYSGSWYRSLRPTNLGQTPSSSASYWSSSPRLLNSWDANRNYGVNDTVYYNGIWYLCSPSNNIGKNPSTNTSYWISTANATYQWNAATSYSAGSYVSYGGVWYYCLLDNTNKTPNNATYWSASWRNYVQVSPATMGAPVIYAEGTVTLLHDALTGSSDAINTIKTQLRATVSPAPLFPNAIAAISTLIIRGAGSVDSYDSTLNSYAGQTPTASAVLAGGDSVTVTSTAVKGYVAAPSASTSPFAPVWYYGGGAALTGTSGSGIDLTRVSRSPFIPQYAPIAVAGATALTLNSGATTSIGTAGATTPIVYSLSSGLSLPSSSDILQINGPVILDISGGLSIAGGQIIIAGTGSAEIHFSGALNVGNGGSGIDNQTKDPKKLILIGTASSGTHNYSSTLPATGFYGVVYMPSASLTIDTGVVIYGALSAQNITFSAEATVHYDTSLRYTTFHGVDSPFMISEWRELTDPNERAVLP